MTYPPNPNRLGRLFAFTLALAASALLLHCNTQPTIENTLTLTLNDSLSAQANKYDSLVIQMVDSLGRPLRDTLFSEPYDLPQDKQKLKDMPLGQAPNPLYVQVRAYYQGALALTLTFVWKDGVQSVKETQVVDIADAAGPGLDTLPNPDPDSTPLPPEVKPPIPGVPSVNITSPSKDTSVNRSPLTLRYSVDAIPAESSVVLKDGRNAIRVLRGNAQGQIGGDSVIVTFDTVAPKVVISSPSESTWTRLSSLPVVWSVDDQAAASQTTEALQGEGLKTIIRESMDPAGNVGSDTVLVIRDTTAPRIIFDEPMAGYQTNADSILVKWRIVDDKGKPLSQSKQDWQKLTDTGSITLTRKGNDLAGNEGIGSVTVKRRLTGLRVNILSPKPMQGTRFDTITVKWEVDGKAQPGLVASLAKEGQNTITVDTVDAFGNQSSAFVIVVRDQVPPGVPVLSRNAALSNAPSWAWKPNAAMGGAKVYRWRMNTGGAAGTWSLETRDSSYAPGSAIPQGTDADYALEVQERDSLGNWSETAASTITVDKKAPPAPVVSAITPTGTATWNWTSGANSDGAKTYRYRLATATNYSGESAATTHTAAGLLTGNHVLYVQERDAAGNWSTDGTFALSLDKTGPQLSLGTPTAMARVTNINPAFSGTITDAHGIKRVEYRIKGNSYVAVTPSAGNWNFTGTFDQGANPVWIRGEDEFGNRDSIQATIYKYPHVVFVRKGATGSGKSWEDAYGELHQALDTTKTYASGTEVWVTVGKYDGNPAYSSKESWVIWHGVKIFGGFSPDKPSSDTSARNLSLGATTLIHSLSLTASSITIDGFTLKDELHQNWELHASDLASYATIRNMKVDGMDDEDTPIQLMGGYSTLENCEFTNNLSYGTVVVSLFGSRYTMKNCRFVNNRTISGGASPISFTDLTVDGGYFEKNSGDKGDFHFGVYDGNYLSIDNASIQGGKASIYIAPESTGTLRYGEGNKSF